VPGVGPYCSTPSCKVLSKIVINYSTDSKGNEVPPDVAAKRLTEVLTDTRNVVSNKKGQGSEGNRDLLGELISVDFQLEGLRDKPIFLKWLIFQKGGQNHLFGNWATHFVAYRLEATTEDDTGTLEMWIPLPKVPGPYFLQLDLSTERAGLASAESDLFG
jgi:hypothetical protein